MRDSAYLMTASSQKVEWERRRALCALLRTPLLQAQGDSAEEYILVRNHSAWLKHWLATFPEWDLYIGKDLARLRKLPPDLLDDTRQAVDQASGSVFSRRRYALLCLVLAAVEQSDRQTTLVEIAETIIEFVSADQNLYRHGFLFEIENYDQRRDLVHAVRLVRDIGVLQKLDGDEMEFLNRSASADVLYDINRHVLAAILNTVGSVSALQIADPEEAPPLERARRLMNQPMPLTDDIRSRRIRSRLVRALLDDPVLYFHELNEEERLYLEQHRSYLLSQISEATGLVAEVRPEGIAMIDEGVGLTDVPFE